MKKTELEWYTDYLICTFGAATATGLSSMIDSDISHDQVTQLLSEQEIQLKRFIVTSETCGASD